MRTRCGALDLIPLDQPREGFRMFIGAWLYHGPEGAFVVDPGPASTIPRLLDEISKRGITKLDYALLSHIHIDHAGGVGELATRYPGMKVVVHESGLRHLVDPKKLNEASRRVLGDLMDTYGDMAAVPQANLMSVKDIGFGSGIRVFPTPGHAPHHQSFVFEDVLFCGENLGVQVPLERGLYMRPSTPPKFYLDRYLGSLKAMEGHTGRVCLGHFGSLPRMGDRLEKSRKQHLLWAEVLREFAGQKAPDLDAMIKHLMDADECFATFVDLPPDIQKREEHLLPNSISGLLGYLRGN